MAVCSYSMICDTQDFLYNPDVGNNIFEYIYFLNNVMCYVSTYYYVYHGIRQYNKWPELMDRMKKLDQKIRREIPMNDQPIKTAEAVAILAAYACCPLMLIIHILYCYLTNPTDIFMPDLLLYYLISQSLINSFVFDIIVYVLYCRFQTINKLIGQLNELSDVLRITIKIGRIKGLHIGICNLVSMVNDIHGLHLLFCSLNCFTMAVATLFQLYIFVVKKDSYFIVRNNFLCIVYVTQFCLICWICTLARQESNRTGRIIFEIISNYKSGNLDKHEPRNQSNLKVQPPLDDLDDEQSSNRSNNHNLSYVVRENLLRTNLDRECITKEINNFSIQLQQNPVAFTACDFFEINNTLFSGFVGVIVTYLVIFIQLYQPEDFNNLLKKYLSEICSENVKNMTLDHNN
ncbi:uncharacterized protein LOC113003081 [Solenopsis invicta]|uniref:uncharacterized protein LOC113003081 n=1 Tax=Solenopsis invicta TaxID=13686 RepID=UPI000E33DE36|nr:uncharacterized protein LOC113003081 [Solenopsis invicta]